jgi:phosphate transport system permease protein
VIRSHVLPYAVPGILTGTVLAFARAIGEAAPLLMVGAVTGLLGSKESLIDTLQGKFTALPMVVYSTAKRPDVEGWPAVTAASILVLLVLLLVANSAAVLLRNRVERKRSR